MGYIPLVKDEQTLLYSNRQTSRSPMISKTEPVQRPEFFDALKDKTKHHYEDHEEESTIPFSELLKYHEKKLTGKGKFFDETI
ncbi:hypothetical protein LGQ02_13840 [Bacillus shivajii]|uniref:hypothetical protein n=1 Tax=Bacillus shivajii TaxID=1983719 RepID=UPI001CF93E50|nr:hypothetical protein [Bacillus shivajii]UCZ51932.1 hypothetical protein LGQ02_13840 [Bacillus shivajii]